MFDPEEKQMFRQIGGLVAMHAILNRYTPVDLSRAARALSLTSEQAVAQIAIDSVDALLAKLDASKAAAAPATELVASPAPASDSSPAPSSNPS